MAFSVNEMSTFISKRRQSYISEESYLATLKHYDADEAEYERQMSEAEPYAGAHAATLRFKASTRWEAFQLKYTGGEPLPALARQLGEVVDAYDAYADENDKKPDSDYYPPVILNDHIDNYVDYLNLLSAAVLLHREDLIPRIYSLIEGGDFDGDDAVIEELLKFFLPDRPSLNYWTWNRPYRTLLDAIDAEDPAERAKLMKRYVSGWYKSMRGKAMFWGKHEKIEPNFSPYHGYWAMCAGAFSYLYSIDDSSYRDEIVYPKDLVDFAGSMPRNAVIDEDGGSILRVVGGDRCPKEGIWFTPSREDSARHFAVGDLMPAVENSDYEATIWQWRAD